VLALRLTSIVLFAAVAGYALQLSLLDSKYRYVVNVATHLELGETVSADVNATAAEIVFKSSFEAGCRSDILRPALTVVLFHLDRTNQAVDYEKWASAHGAAENFLSSMIRCMPSDGNVWLREAVVSRAIAEDPTSLKQKMAMSNKLMPYEAPQVFARLAIWKRISPFALAACEGQARSDIRTALVYGSRELKASLKMNMSAAFAALLKREINNLAALG